MLIQNIERVEKVELQKKIYKAWKEEEFNSHHQPSNWDRFVTLHFETDSGPAYSRSCSNTTRAKLKKKISFLLERTILYSESKNKEKAKAEGGKINVL